MGFLSNVLGTGNSFQASGDPGAQGRLANEEAQQQQVAGMLMNTAQGNGPNIAGQQLQQATNENVANASGILSSAKGLNPALAARLAAQQAGSLGQQAAGQSAITAGQQSLAATQALGNSNLEQQGIIQHGIDTSNQVNAGVASGNQQMAGKLAGGVIGGIGSSLGLAHGGMVPHYADGGAVNPFVQQPTAGPQSTAGKFLSGFGSTMAPQGAQADPLQSGISSGISGALKAAFGKGTPSAPAAPIGGSQASDYSSLSDYGTGNNIGDYTSLNAKGGMPEDNMVSGGNVPGKAKVKDDSYSNDVVPAELSPGEIVIPRHITMHKDAPEMAAAFVKAALAKKQMEHGGEDKKMFADGGDVEEDDEGGAGGGESAPPSGATGSWQSADSPSATTTTPGSAPAAVPTPGNMTPDTLSALQGAFEEQRKGVMQQAGAEGARAKLESGILGKQQADLEAQNQQSQGQFKDLDQERQNLVDDVKKGAVDPNNFVGSMDTPKKVSTAIGLILGGIGSGLTGQANPALQLLQSHIDNDIKAQQTNLGSKENLLSANFRQFGNLKDAQAMTRAHMMDMASLGLKKAAADTTNDAVKGRALQAAGQLYQQATQTIGPLKYKQQLLQGIQKGTVDPMAAINQVVEPGQRAKAIDEAGKAAYVAQNQERLMKLWDQANKEQDSLSGKTLMGMKEGPARQALSLAMDPILKDEVGRINPIVKQDSTNVMPSSFTTKGSLDTRRAEFANFIKDRAATPTLNANRIDLSRFPQYNTQGAKGSAGTVISVKPGNSKGIAPGNYQVGAGGKLVRVN